VSSLEPGSKRRHPSSLALALWGIALGFVFAAIVYATASILG